MDNLKRIKKMIGDKTCPPEYFHIGCFQEKGEEFFNYIKEDLMNAKYLRCYCATRINQKNLSKEGRTEIERLQKLASDICLNRMRQYAGMSVNTLDMKDYSKMLKLAKYAKEYLETTTITEIKYRKPIQH